MYAKMQKRRIHGRHDRLKKVERQQEVKMNNSRQSVKTRKMTGLAIFSAIIVVLQVVSTFVKFGPFSITLSLAPIIIGAAIYGVGAGAILGFVFSAVVVITGILGWDGGFIMMLMGISPVGLLITALGKGTLAGWVSGLVYKAISKKNELLGVITAGVVCPVVNTGFFVVGMLLFFADTFTAMAGGQDLVSFIIFGLAGINFVIELLVNLVLSSGITQIIKAGKKMR